MVEKQTPCAFKTSSSLQQYANKIVVYNNAPTKCALPIAVCKLLCEAVCLFCPAIQGVFLPHTLALDAQQYKIYTITGKKNSLPICTTIHINYSRPVLQFSLTVLKNHSLFALTCGYARWGYDRDFWISGSRLDGRIKCSLVFIMWAQSFQTLAMIVMHS